MVKNLSWYAAFFLVIILLIFTFAVPLPPAFVVVNAFIAFLISIFIIIKSTDYMVDSITDYSKKLRLPTFLVGFAIISAATTFPDLSAGIFAALEGHGDLIMGDVITAIIVDLGLLTAIAALIMRRIPTKKGGELSGTLVWGIVGLAFLPLIFGFNGKFSRIEGIILLSLFAVYLLVIIIKEVRVAHIVKEIAFKKIWRDIFIFAFALTAILLAARWTVESSTFIAERFGIPTFVVGLFLVAAGTSLPEVVFQIKAARSGVIDIGFGNSLGSLLLNSLLVTGAAATVRPFEVPRGSFLFSYGYMMFVVILIVLLFRKKYITWKDGMLILGLFGVFIVINVFLAISG